MRITKSMPVDEWRKYTVIQEGDLGHGPHGDHKNYLIVAMEGKYWYVEYWDDALYRNSKGGFDAVEGEVVEMQPRLVWVGKNWLDGEDEVKAVKEGPMHGRLIWDHDLRGQFGKMS